MDKYPAVHQKGRPSSQYSVGKTHYLPVQKGKGERDAKNRPPAFCEHCGENRKGALALNDRRGRREEECHR